MKFFAPWNICVIYVAIFVILSVLIAILWEKKLVMNVGKNWKYAMDVKINVFVVLNAIRINLW